tara:strand:- start:5297 stop:5665 length:369 start_codon:yes stop_codon:yes gene_type:complete
MAAPNLVNVSSIYGKTMGAALGTTTTTSLLANSAGSNKLLKINSIIVSNVDGSSAATTTVSWYDGTTDYRLASTVTIPANSTLVLLGKDAPIYMEEGHSIRGGASAASDLEIVISYEELDDA